MKDIYEIVKERHSVRKYIDKPIDEDIVKELTRLIDDINKENDLHIQLVLNNSKTFDKFVFPIDKLKAYNYLAMIGKKDNELSEKIGYFGEQLVIKAQELGLNTCWVSGSLNRKHVFADIFPNEELVCVIAIGYGETQGNPRRSKTFDEVSKSKNVPDWYKQGIEYALLAPTAINQQKFEFELLDNNKVLLKDLPGIADTKLDLGIVRYHFELGANHNNFTWK